MGGFVSVLQQAEQGPEGPTPQAPTLRKGIKVATSLATDRAAPIAGVNRAARYQSLNLTPTLPDARQTIRLGRYVRPPSKVNSNFSGNSATSCPIRPAPPALISRTVQATKEDSPITIFAALSARCRCRLRRSSTAARPWNEASTITL